MHRGIAKSNGICVLVEPDSGEVLRCRLPLNTYLLFPVKLHICRSDTTAIDRHQTHRCNTIWPSVLDPPPVEWPPAYEPKPRPNPKYNAFDDLLLSECRFCFFIANESEQFIHFSFFDRFRQGRTG